MGSTAPAGQTIKRALVVDDDYRIVAALTHLLETLGMEWESVSSEMALGRIAAFDPDLLLLDVKLGFSDAFCVLRSHLGARFDGVVCVMSGSGLEVVMDVLAFGEQRGLRMSAPLLKPFTNADVLEILRIAETTREPTAHPTETDSRARTDAGADLRLEQALREDRLELWYQPKCFASTGRMFGAECLIRARAEDGRIVSPSELLADASRLDLVKLTDFVLTEAAARVQVLTSLGSDYRLSVNVPAFYLLHKTDPVGVVRSAALAGNWPGLILEITEDEALKDIADLQAVAAQLRLYGISLSIDGFGAAYASLSRLRDLPFAEIKLARDFVQGCSTDSVKRHICRNVLSLGEDLGTAIVAEGVEDESDFETLVSLGCELMQGSRFARTMPFHQLQRFASPARLLSRTDDLSLPVPMP